MAMKKMFLGFLSLFLILGMRVMPINAIDSLDGYYLMKTAQLFNNLGKEFTSSEELSFNDEFKLRVSLKDITTHSDLSGEKVSSGISYTLLSLPRELDAKISQDIEWSVKMGTRNLGIAKYSKDTREISIKFDNDINDEDTITDAYLEMEVKLDKDECGDKQKIDISMGGSSPTYSITITENKPKPPVVEKKVVYNLNDKTFEWTVDIKKGGISYNSGLRFIDTFSNNQDYVKDSFYINSIKVDGTLLVIDKQMLTYLTPLEDNQDYNITYKKKLNTASLITNGKVENNKEVTVSNKAQLNDIEKDIPVSYDQKELKQNTGIDWIEKTVGEKVIKSDGVYIPWTISIDTNGYAFKDVVIKDIIKKGKPANASSQLSIVDDSIKINNISVSWYDITSSNNSSIVDRNDYYWTMNLNNVLSKDTLKGVYTITYETKITNYNLYMKYNQVSIKNDASITFGCPEFDGIGPGGTFSYGTPSVVKETNINEGTIKKEFKNYNKSNHQITWRVTFNQNKSAITDKVTIKDFIDVNNQHNIIEVNNFMLNGAATNISALDCVIDKSDKQYDFVFNDPSLISQNVISFEVVTELSDSDFFENNNIQTKEFKNSATIYLGALEYSTVYATYKPEIKVLSKEAKGYDYKNHVINWEIKVNHDEMNLKNAIIEDALIDGVSLVEESLKLKNIDGDIALSKDTSYTYNNNILKVYLGDIDKEYTLSFQTRVDVENGVFNNLSSRNYNGKITIKNTATLKKDSSLPSSVETNQEILNRALEKSGTAISSDQKINYRVIVNQARTSMNKTELKDILCPGLSLSLSSIHLFEATVNEKGEFNKSNEINAEFDTSILSEGNIYNKPEGSTLLSLSIPKNNGTAYILEYYAYVKDFTLANYTNDIQGEGILPGEIKTSSVINSTELGVVGGAQTSKSSTVIYTLVDKKDKTKVISGAEFTLYYNGKVVGVAITDEDGKVVFSGLDEDVEYNLVQTKTNDGYIPEEAVNVKFTAPKKGYSNRKEVTVENVRRLLDIHNIDNQGNVMDDSEFGLYKITDDVDEIIDKDKVIDILVDENLIEKQLTNQEGNVVFGKDMSDGLYIIRQLSVSDDYYLCDEYLVVKVVNGLVINIYYLSDDDKTLNNVIVNKRKVIDVIPDPIPKPDPIIPEPKPIVPTPKPVIPDVKPVKPNIPVLKPSDSHQVKKIVKTNDNSKIEIIIVFIAALSLILMTLKKRIRK